MRVECGATGEDRVAYGAEGTFVVDVAENKQSQRRASSVDENGDGPQPRSPRSARAASTCACAADLRDRGAAEVRRAALLALLRARSRRRRWAKPAPEAAAYLQEMERRGLVDKTAVTPEMLAAEVRAADDELVAGQPAAAAARLYAIVEGPRYQDFSDTDDFQDAEYRLGLALARGGGVDHRAALPGALAAAAAPRRPTTTPRCAPTSTSASTSTSPQSCAAEIDKLGAEDVNEELAYLRGRALYDGSHFERAEQELGLVTPQSRASTRRRSTCAASCGSSAAICAAPQDAFCAIADVKAGDRIRFYIDGRYYALRIWRGWRSAASRTRKGATTTPSITTS